MRNEWQVKLRRELSKRICRSCVPIKLVPENAHLNQEIIPEDALLSHVSPFFDARMLKSDRADYQDLLPSEQFKSKEVFFHILLDYLHFDKAFSSNKSKGEVAIFAFILKNLIFGGELKKRLLSFSQIGYSFFSKIDLKINFNHCNDLQSILDGNFIASLDYNMHAYAEKFYMAFFIAMAPLIMGIVFLNLNNTFDLEIEKTIGEMFLLLFFPFFLVPPVYFGFVSRCNARQQNEALLSECEYDTHDLIQFSRKYNGKQNQEVESNIENIVEDSKNSNRDDSEDFHALSTPLLSLN